MRQKKGLKLILLLMMLFFVTGCTTTLVDKDKKAVKNPETGQSLTENILCKPTSKTTIKAYEKNGVNVDKLPDCEDFKITSGKYEGLWTTFLIKPLAFVILWIGKYLGSFALAVIAVSLAIRLIAYPVTKKTAIQSELLKKANPELERLKKKYEGKTDQESMMKQSQEMLMIYKKYNISPKSGCLFSFLQLPLFIAFFEAINRVPAIFEDNFLGLQLGTTPMVGFASNTVVCYVLLAILIGLSTYFSFKLNATANMDPSMKMMPYTMTGIIFITGLFMPSALGIYWVTSNLFTIVQNILVKRSKEFNGKA